MEWLRDNAKAIGILRVSSSRQRDNTSHEVQRHDVEEYCRSHGLKLENLFQIVESAKDSERRKKYHGAINWALDNDVKHVVFYMFDREARNLTDNEENENLVRRNQIVLHYVRDQKVLHKWSPDSDFLMRDFHAIQNKQYSRNLSVKVSDSMRRKAEDGWYPNNKPPLGYVPISTFNEDGKERKRGKIVGLDSDIRRRQQVIREFELRARELSFEEIRRVIIEEGFIPRNRITNYHATVIETRLKNPFYRGYFVWEGKTYTGKHELFVPKSLVEAVDRTLYKKSFKTKPITNENALAGGWLKCAEPSCGCNIVYEKKTKKYRDGTFQDFHYYHCTNGKGVHPSLKGMNVRDEAVWSQFEKALDCISISESFAKKVADSLNEATERANVMLVREIEGFSRRVEDSYAEEEELYRDFKKCVISEESYLRMVSQVHSQRTRIAKQLEQARLANSDASLETAKSVLELSMSLKTLWKSRPPLDRRELLSKLLSNPTLDGTTVRYEIKKPFRILAEMAESEKWRTRKGSNL